MNTIILIILTIIFLLFVLAGILFIKVGFGTIPSISVILFIIGIGGLFYLGSTLIGDDLYIKDTICSYTVGKSDQVCSDIYSINLDFRFPTISDKIGLSYFIVDFILIIVLIREILLALWHMGDCIRRD